MKKTISLLTALVFAASVGVASAATISNPLFSNGDTTIDATGGSTVSGTFTLTVGPNEVCEWLRTQSDPSQPFTDTSVGGQLGYQEQVYTNVPFSVKVPPNTGTVYPTVQCAGIYGGIRAINGGDNVVVGPTALGTIRVVSILSQGPNTGGVTSSDMTMLLKIITELQNQMSCLNLGNLWTPGVNGAAGSCTVKPAPTKPAGCAGVVAFNGSNAWEAQTSLFAVDAGRAVFNANGVFVATGHFKTISGQAATAVAIACK